MAVTPKDDVQQIFMSEQERQAGKYSAETLGRVLGAMNHDGLIVLKEVIPVDLIDRINAKMCKEADDKLADPSQAYNHGIKCGYCADRRGKNARTNAVESQFSSKTTNLRPRVPEHRCLLQSLPSAASKCVSTPAS